MALKVQYLDIKTRIPKLPTSMSLLELKGTSLDERQWAISFLSRRLDLGDLKPIETPNSLVFASKRGEVEYFHASGAIWARNTEADEKAENEERKWTGLREIGEGINRHFALEDKSAKQLSEHAKSLLGEAGLLREHILRADVELDQVAHLDEKGGEISRGAGSATVKFIYGVEGLRAFGPGAKSLVFAEPKNGELWITGAFHAWREVAAGRQIKLSSIESAMSVGLLKDPELNQYHKRGHRMQITRLDFGYLALPVFVPQRFLFPAFQVEGTVISPKNKSDFFHFGRYYHVATPKQYAKADAYADYLFRSL
jgi:hypothetical protein